MNQQPRPVDPEQLARHMYSVRFENVDRQGWEGLPQDVRDAYMREAREIGRRLGAPYSVDLALTQVPRETRPESGVLLPRRTDATSLQVRTAFEVAFVTGVLYASPAHAEGDESFMEMVRSESRKRAVNYLKQVHHA